MCLAKFKISLFETTVLNNVKRDNYGLIRNWDFSRKDKDW